MLEEAIELEERANAKTRAIEGPLSELTTGRNWNEEYQFLLRNGIMGVTPQDIPKIVDLTHDFCSAAEAYAKYVYCLDPSAKGHTVCILCIFVLGSCDHCLEHKWLILSLFSLLLSSL